LNPQNFSPIQELIQQVVVTQNPMALAKNINVDFNSEKCSNDIKVNSFYANLILDNLIGNAIKYSNINGEVSIQLVEDTDSVTCTIKDRGIGIRKEDLDQIFTPFFRSDALNHKEIKGVGLGLSIVQKAAIAINASLEISSDIGQGTVITVNFKEILRKV
jgi:signal transduction histidine kinase